MKLSREFINGVIIFLGISLYFLLMEALGLSDQFFLRVLNLFIVIYGVNRTIKMNIAENIGGYIKNLFSAFTTAMTGAILGIIGLLIYIPYKGGQEYLNTLSKGFLFGGGSPNTPQYCIGLLFESTAASLIICFCMMQFYKSRVESINKIS